jgi:hypothetical protein
MTPYLRLLFSPLRTPPPRSMASRRFAGERPADQFSKAEIEAMWRALRRNAKLDKRRALNREAWRLLEAAAD